MSWSILSRPRKAGKVRQIRRAWEEQIAKLRTERKSRTIALGEPSGTSTIAADFQVCGCGVMIWARHQNGITTIVREERVQCADHKGEHDEPADDRHQ